MFQYHYWLKGPVTKDNDVVLINAMRFKSTWEYKFKDTVDDSFYVTPSNKITVKMMVLKRFLQYYHDFELKFSALALPYEVNIVFKLVSIICAVSKHIIK